MDDNDFQYSVEFKTMKELAAHIGLARGSGETLMPVSVADLEKLLLGYAERRSFIERMTNVAHED